LACPIAELADNAGSSSAGLRLCLDLNVWCAVLLANMRGRTGTASQRLVETVARGTCGLGPTQLVVSWGMLTRLRDVLERKLRVPRTRVDAYLQAIVGYASQGPMGEPPLLLLGGTGVVALRDEEDAHVLESAVAGEADILATANFDDFVNYRSRIVQSGRVAIHDGPRKRMLIAHPVEVATWEREGRTPDR
jgi:hypothetical protein